MNEPLPPVSSAWFSQLKNRSVCGTRPKEIDQNYKSVKCCWENGGMKFLRDLLIKYPIDDVRPIIVGIENILQHYK